MKREKMTDEQKKARREQRKIEREAAKHAALIETYINQPKVATLTMTIEWKKSRTWGNCPRIHAHAVYKTPDKSGSYRGYFESYASGYGYDKAATVVADAFNHFLKGYLYRMDFPEVRPYGIRYWKETNSRSFEGGVGVECYPSLTEFIGGEWEHISWTDSTDVYRVTFK